MPRITEGLESQIAQMSSTITALGNVTQEDIDAQTAAAIAATTALIQSEAPTMPTAAEATAGIAMVNALITKLNQTKVRLQQIVDAG